MLFESGGRRIYCPHCKDYLSKSAYYRHRRQFFDRTKKEWRLDVAASKADVSSSEDDLEDFPAMHDASEESFESSTLSRDELQLLPPPEMQGSSI